MMKQRTTSRSPESASDQIVTPRARVAPAHRAECRLKAGRALFSTASFAAVVIALTAFGTGSSYALYTASTTTAAGVVTAGTQNVLVNGASSTSIGALSGFYPLKTTGPIQLKLSNTGDTDVSFVISTSSVVNADTRDIGGSLSARVAFTSTDGGCSAALTATVGWKPLVGFVSVASPALAEPVPPATGTHSFACLEIRMNDGAPVSLQGGFADAGFVINATQVI
ncbi:MAG: hypothetical protein JWL94_1264 [Microbacteriaceae bacterium]|jgi:hypothetical protein|nr:hypothetical protein [Microbacteriaceae bacterium]